MVELFKKDYPTFVKELGENITDSKFTALLIAGDATKDEIDFEETSYTVSALIPTQDEIDIDKSLSYPLQKEKKQTLVNYFNAQSKDVFAPGGAIVTAGGKYIVDGHHRWSQLYLMNPNAKIKAINMKIKGKKNNIAKKALKMVQLSIASIKNAIPVSIVKGKNLLTIEKSAFDTWVKKNVSNNARKAFKEIGINKKTAIAQYIWKHVLQMRDNNKPIEEASNRGYMPQTDKAPGWQRALQEGAVNVRY